MGTTVLLDGEGATSAFFARSDLVTDQDAEPQLQANYPLGVANLAKEKIVLIFHGIGDPPCDIPREECPYWVSRSLLRDVVNLVRDKQFAREVVLTFDDGNESDLLAVEELTRAGLAGHFFLLAGRLDQVGYINAAGAREISQAGMEVGLHGHSHVDWRKTIPARWRLELVEARDRVAEAAERPVNSVAIPFGSYDRTVLKQLDRHSFERIYTSDAGPTPAHSRILRRTAVMRDFTIENVIDVIEDKRSLLKRARGRIAPLIKKWR
jgi:peptidoglycan/xylan/chitin deacetylase (PgdA/CDA1 family)